MLKISVTTPLWRATYIYGAAGIPVEGNSLNVGAADYGQLAAYMSI